MGQRLLGDAHVRGDLLLLGEAGLMAQLGAAAAEVLGEFVGGPPSGVEPMIIGPVKATE